MAESNNDVQAIERISAAVGESQIKIILSNQCVKAQTFLVNRLQKQFQHQKEISKFISTDNLKLNTEIKNAEQEIKSLMLAHESIKSANVELKKEWYLAKERTQETAERIQTGQKKYEKLWEQCKSRYESIGFVQNWLQAKRKAEDLTQALHGFETETQKLLKEIKTREDIVLALDKKRIIELAEFVIHEKPRAKENITRMYLELKELNEQFEQLQEKRNSEEPNNKHKADLAVVNLQTKSQRMCNAQIYNDWHNENKDFSSNADNLMPKLQLMSIDLDILSVKLDQIKKCDLVVTNPAKEATLANVEINEMEPKFTCKDKDHEEYISYYFKTSANDSNSTDETKGNNCNNYSVRKLINILENIKIDKTEACNLVSKANLDNFLGVPINTNVNTNINCPSEFVNKDKEGAQDKEIEEINMPFANTENILMPPSGFLDQLSSSQDKKKKVSFELPITMQNVVAESKNDVPNAENVEENNVNVTISSPLEVSLASDESFTKTKDLILKKHNLDLSPQFVYAKNTVLQKNEDTIKSNYFKLTGEEIRPSILGENYEKGEVKITEIMAEEEIEIDCAKPTESNDFGTKDQSVEIKVDEEDISSVEVKQRQDRGKQVTGLLFSHGPQGLPESLDISISTTGLEDGDGCDVDFPQYSSLLMSPKADFPITTNTEKLDVASQEVPNFLSGLRKTGLSFFGKTLGVALNNEDAVQSEGNSFNFKFGTDDKKNRGGIFNMFN